MHRKPLNRLAAGFAAAAMLAAGIPGSLRAAAFPPLNSTPTSQQVPGRFIWADLFSEDPGAASAFYCSLFGWTSEPVEQKNKSYIILSNGDHPVAGVVQRSGVASKRESVWIGYISVVDAKSALSTAVSDGGVEHAPVRHFPKRGSQAILSDSEGSPVGILQSSSGDPADDEPKPGDWNWFQLYSLTPEATANFYGKAFGYEVKADDRPDKAGHFILSASGQARAGVAPLPAGPESKPGWLGCVRVADIDDAANKAVSLGGAVVVAPRPAALGSRFAVVTDPTGGAIGLVQYVDNANPAASK